MHMISRASEKGQAALTVVVFLLFISLAVSAGLVSVAIREARVARTLIEAKKSFYAAEAGQEDAVYRIKKGMNISSAEAITLNGAQVNVTISDVSGTKEILAEGNLQNAIRRVKSSLRQGISGVGFVYGVQVDAGGLEMENNSRIEGVGGSAGNVYSNGPIEGENGATVTGSATVAGSAGTINDVIVYGNARVHGITSSKVCGDAYYSTIDASSLTFLNGPSAPTCPTPLTPGTANPGSADPSSLAFPISSSQIQQWKEDALAGGVINGNCGDNGAAECVIANNGTLVLGPRKIVGNLVLTKKQTLVVLGTLHVTGSIDINSSSGATVKCDPSFGALSCIIVADSWMHVSNNAVFQGSGTAGSYLMVLTTLSGCNGGSQTTQCTHHNSGIDFHNNAAGAIFFSPYSMAYLHNGVHLTELMAYKIELENNAIVTYEQGLADVDFSSGPTGGWMIQSWQEVR